MKHELEPPDSHHLNAAEGWLGLSQRDEAMIELQKISSENQRHPDVLEVRWGIYAEEREWNAAIEVARRLMQRAPDRASGWLNHAYAVRRAPGGGLEKAWEALRPAAGKFPKEPTVAFNLACYACQLGQTEEAREWLLRAFKAGNKDKIKELAMSDDDLRPMWEEIRKL